MPEGQEHSEPQPISQWSEAFAKQGIHTSVSPDVLTKINTHPDAKIDRLTNLPTEDDVIRKKVVDNLKSSLVAGKNFACIYADVDQLKAANNIHRKFGDEVIKFGAAQATSILTDIDMDNLTVFALRQGDAADETVIWLFDLTDEQLEELKEKTAAFNKSKTNIDLEGGKKFKLSSSASLATNKDAELTELIAQEQSDIQTGTHELPYELYENIKVKLDDSVKLSKVAKEISSVPIEEASKFRSPNKIIDLFADEFGGQRLSKRLLKAIMTISQKADRLVRDEAPEATMMEHLGIDQSASEFMSSEDLRVLYYDKLLHEMYDDVNNGEDE